jgi:PST family polysaccharide transporter
MKDDGRDQPLRARVVKGLSWTMLQSWATHLMTLLVFLVTARLLGPEAFGTVVLAYTTVGALLTLVDLGLGDALLRKKNATQEDNDIVFWTLVASSAVMFIAVCATAGLVARVMEQPPLEWVMIVVGITVPVYALGALPPILLRRQLQFKPLAQRAMISTAAGGVVGIAMAATGFSYWALVAKGLVEAFTSTALVWRQVDYRPRRRFDRSLWREMFAVGRPLTVSRLFDLVNQRADSFIISAHAGPGPLGLYAAAHRVYRTLMDALFMAIQKVALPAFAQIADDPPRTQQALLRMIRLTSFLTFPLFAIVGLLADPLVPALFGARWSEAAPILSAFCAAGLLFSVSYYNSPLMTAAGRTDYVMHLTILNTVLNLVAFLVGIRWGPLGVAIGFALRGYVTFPVNLWMLRRTIGMRVAPYASALLPNLTTTVLAIALGWVVSYEVVASLPAWPRLTLTAASAVLVQLLASFILFPHNLAMLLREARGLFRGPRITSLLDRLIAFTARRTTGRDA